SNHSATPSHGPLPQTPRRGSVEPARSESRWVTLVFTSDEIRLGPFGERTQGREALRIRAVWVTCPVRASGCAQDPRRRTRWPSPVRRERATWTGRSRGAIGDSLGACALGGVGSPRGV